jgi:Fur family peroxide stress response transcriptional regulator
MKYSKQRNLVLSIVRNTDIHPSAEWVYEQAKKEMPSIGIATVYRNLNALVGSGEIERITAAGHVDRFDGQISEHCHMQCVRCGKLEDLYPDSEENMDKLRKLICETFGVEDKNVRISRTLLRGICNTCLESEN